MSQGTAVGTIYQQALEDYVPLLERPLPEPSLETGKLLKQFHPDYIDSSRTRLETGVNRGDSCHVQLAQILQSDSRINEADLAGAATINTDVLVIGGGGAGCAAALIAQQQGAHVILATKLRLGDSNTVMAEGGIQASINKEDSPQSHFDDTLKAGHHHGNPDLIAELAMDGPDTIRWLIQQGMQFDLDEFGDLLTRRAGGTSAERICFYRDYTGLEMMRVLREAVHNSNIDVWDYSPTVELLGDDMKGCSGAVISSLKTRKYIQVNAKAVVLATGGIGRMHLNDFPTSNHFGATGDGLVLAYRIGAALRDLDSFQYHPTGLAHPYHLAGMLITEGVRSCGTYLLNNKGERFVDELAARDIVAAAIIRECKEGRGIVTEDNQSGVWLDTPGIELRQPGILRKRFPKLMRLGDKAEIDITQKPMLIYPTLHYQNGGIVINEQCETEVPGLFCVGEVSGGIHGKNRLMGNALLEIISFGRKAGLAAAKRRKNKRSSQLSIEHLNQLRRELTTAEISLDYQGPLLFPEYAKFDLDLDYVGLHRNRRSHRR
ncbi:MAG: FAD-binding protein [Gammaproteobacteria bacterium]|jgi:succinate dehydrogenase / fumarate reductase flavoprotein subunit/L-aspartate oxidase|nr:FAD-binding protein [Gammaproteobacteria bacterium]MBT3488423.1 FAD-binding protein [Gammaproteobacteria bacterium]MBT3718833.1 FAD-binding protein [Gammaproteobacteria bacterium]MBT3845853.1 FAD-binding protein [Gammaproteobacteria bacterium]MBT3894306.1 FAD-binding protein [Gammaproteobacteria bacterium]